MPWGNKFPDMKNDPSYLEGRLSNAETSLADRVTKAPYHYYVGSIPMKYITITDAVNAWIADGKPNGIVYISQGVYKERINLSGTSNLSFIGEGKSLVTWKMSTGYYDDAPLAIGGNVLIKGITFLTDTSDNPSYTYTAYTGANTGAAYGLHIDDTTAVGEVVVEDCDIISYVNAGLGSGTRINQQIKLVNTRVFSYSNITAVKVNGALLYHTSATTGATNQKFTARYCYFYSQNDKAMTISSVGDNTVVPLDMSYNTCDSGTLTVGSLVSMGFSSGATQIKTILTNNSCGNNEELLNSPLSSWQKFQLTKSSGTAITVTDLNTSQAGYFMCNGGAGGLNTPTAAWYIGESIRYSEGGNPYIVQYAWAMTDSFKKYMRTCSNGVWGTWTFIPETNLPSNACLDVTDANSAMYGKWRCNGAAGGLNTPTASWYIGESTSYDGSTYTIQYAWAILDSYKKYRRTYASGTWSAWALCSDYNTDIIGVVRSVLNISSTGYAGFISDANNANISGYYFSNMNTPTATNYFIHHIGYDANNAVQEAFVYGTGTTKYRRSKSGGTWGSWVSA